MPKYTVYLSGELFVGCEVEIEADTEEEALEKALEDAEEKLASSLVDNGPQNDFDDVEAEVIREERG